MALFTDGPINDAGDLQGYEGDILNVATEESINLGAKLRLAQQDLGNELVLFLLRRSSFLNTGRDTALGFRRARELNDVVVSEPMRQWHVHKTLAMIYQDAYNNQLNERYQGKWKEYEQLATASKSTYFQIGVGLVASPVPKGPLLALASVTGAGTGGTYYVAGTWVNAAGQEGIPSEFAEITTSDGQKLTAAVGSAPRNITGWNVYVGVSPTTATLQNQSPLTVGSVWTMTSGPNQGPGMPAGQMPSWFVVDHRMIERG
jgi:hypothetical protein